MMIPYIYKHLYRIIESHEPTGTNLRSVPYLYLSPTESCDLFSESENFILINHMYIKLTFPNIPQP